MQFNYLVSRAANSFLQIAALLAPGCVAAPHDYEAARKGLLEIFGRLEEFLKRNPGE